jgi:hypothetical protein
VVAHHQQERVAPGKGGGAGDCMPVTKRPALFDELQPAGMGSRRGAKGRLVAGMHDETHLLDAGGQRFLNENAQGGLLHAVAIHESLEGQGSLVTTGRGDDSFFNVHDVLLLVSYQRRRLTPERCHVNPTWRFAI